MDNDLWFDSSKDAFDIRLIRNIAIDVFDGVDAIMVEPEV